MLHSLCRSPYNPIWEFGYTINGQQCDMVFTSVAGHLMELEFPAQYKRWRACSPLDLYTAPVVKDVPAVSRVLYAGDCLHAAFSPQPPTQPSVRVGRNQQNEP